MWKLQSDNWFGDWKMSQSTGRTFPLSPLEKLETGFGSRDVSCAFHSFHWCPVCTWFTLRLYCGCWSFIQWCHWSHPFNLFVLGFTLGSVRAYGSFSREVGSSHKLRNKWTVNVLIATYFFACEKQCFVLPPPLVLSPPVEQTLVLSFAIRCNLWSWVKELNKRTLNTNHVRSLFAVWMLHVKTCRNGIWIYIWSWHFQWTQRWLLFTKFGPVMLFNDAFWNWDLATLICCVNFGFREGGRFTSYTGGSFCPLPPLPWQSLLARCFNIYIVVLDRSIVQPWAGERNEWQHMWHSRVYLSSCLGPYGSFEHIFYFLTVAAFDFDLFGRGSVKCMDWMWKLQCDTWFGDWKMSQSTGRTFPLSPLEKLETGFGSRDVSCAFHSFHWCPVCTWFTLRLYCGWWSFIQWCHWSHPFKLFVLRFTLGSVWAYGSFPREVGSSHKLRNNSRQCSQADGGFVVRSCSHLCWCIL